LRRYKGNWAAIALAQQFFNNHRSYARAKAKKERDTQEEEDAADEDDSLAIHHSDARKRVKRSTKGMFVRPCP
jgi:hypothetical protein